MESVRIYVISPTVSSARSIPSYNFWATIIVFLDENFNLFDDSCCIVLVVNGGFDCLFLRFLSMLSIVNVLDNLLKILSASSSVLISIFLCLYSNRSASKSLKLAIIVQYSSGLKAFISLSLSTISLRATLWTRPAELPSVLDLISLLNLKPIILSRILLASWLLTKFWSIFPSCLNASKTAFLVTSWKTTLL